MQNTITIIMFETVSTSFDVSPDWLKRHGLPQTVEGLEATHADTVFKAIDSIPQRDHAAHNQIDVTEREFEFEEIL